MFFVKMRLEARRQYILCGKGLFRRRPIIGQWPEFHRLMIAQQMLFF